MRFTKKDLMFIFILFTGTIFLLSAMFEKYLSKLQTTNAMEKDGGQLKSQGVVMSLISRLERLTKNYTLIQLFQNNTGLEHDLTGSQPVTHTRAPTTKPPIFEDGVPLINRRVAQDVNEKVRVLCWIPSSEMFRQRLNAVNATWVKRCDKVIFIISSPKFKSNDTVGVDIADSRATLNDKTVFAHRHIYKHYMDKFDWFLKADDDTYVIMENLKFLLSHFDLKTPGYIGCQLRHYSPQGYMNGGAGYAYNALGIKTIVEQGYNIPGRCRLNQGPEDIENGYCANKAGVKTFDQLDLNGKQTFLSSSVYENVVGPLPLWTNSNLLAHAVLGLNCCSPLVVSFHHADEKLMLAMEYLLYRVVVHGRVQVPEKARGMFSGKEAPEILKSVPRRAYPGEVIVDYYEGKEAWKKSNVTAHDRSKRQNIATQRREREAARLARLARLARRH